MVWMNRERPADRAWWLALALVVVFLAAHLPFLAPTLEDVDSINFALGVRDFDPAKHQPHPPGYPIYVGLAKTARLVMSEPHALAFWAALFGALAILPLLRLFQALDSTDRRPGAAEGGSGWWSAPVLATLVTVTAPLYWMTAVRPMSDSVGLAFALLAQALLATAFVRQFQDVPDTRGSLDPVMAARSGRLILAGAFVAALSVGVRSQNLWLTAPLLLLVIVSRVGRGAAGALIGSTVWYLLGGLLWLVPLVVASGGPSAYLSALTSQGGEDWTGVDLLITRPSLRRLASGLTDTFVTHWAGLGWVIVAAAVVGAIVVLVTRRRTSGFLLFAFGPYAVFHLVFQESVTTRYALPLVVPVVYLAVCGLWTLGRIPATLGAVACAAVALVQVVPVTARYASGGSPVFQAMADVRVEVGRPGSAVLGRYFSFARALQAGLDDDRVTVLTTPPRRAWLELARFVTTDTRRPLWVFDTPRQTDLALFDPSSLVLRKAYRWPFDARTYLGGVRPSDVDWLEIREPGWVAAEGWHLTPDTAGMAVADGKGLGSGPISAQVRTRAGAAVALVGGRHLGRSTDADLVFAMSVGGREIESWRVTQAAGFFLRFVVIPEEALAGPGAWVPLTIEARGASSGQPSGLGAIDQFNLQDVGRLMVGFDTGWHEQELDTGTGVLWRWASGRADLRVQSSGQDVVLRIVGESPLRSFNRPSRITLKAGSRTLIDLAVGETFDWTIPVPASALAESRGVVTMTTDQVFRPADRGENADRRALGVRVFSVTVTPAS